MSARHAHYAHVQSSKITIGMFNCRGQLPFVNSSCAAAFPETEPEQHSVRYYHYQTNSIVNFEISCSIFGNCIGPFPLSLCCSSVVSVSNTAQDSTPEIKSICDICCISGCQGRIASRGVTSRSCALGNRQDLCSSDGSVTAALL